MSLKVAIASLVSVIYWSLTMYAKCLIACMYFALFASLQAAPSKVPYALHANLKLPTISWTDCSEWLTVTV